MTAGAAVDDKRADERRIKELREFQRSNPANKRCFDCNEMMPQYVCVDFNTYVCTSCSGIHREFGHRVKSISMSKFTDTEVKNMLKFGGNEAAQKIWRAKHDANFRPSGGTDGERTRNFIRLTYIDKKWQYESPRSSTRDEPQKRSGSGSVKKPAASDDDFFSSKASKAAPSFDAFGDTSSQSNNGGFASFGDFSSFDEPKKQQHDFEDFGRFDSPKSTTSSTAGGFADFGNFSSKPAAAPPLRDEFKTGSFTLAPPPGSDFGAFSAPASVPVSTPPAPAKPPSSGNDFLAFSPVKTSSATDDPFGFASSPATSAKTSSQKAATPFDAFGSPVAANSNRSSFDAFGAPASTGSRSASSSFDAFGATSPATPAATFDAFGASAQPAAPQSPGFGAFGAASPVFDAFGASPAAKTSSSSSFDAFGATPPQPSTSTTTFDAFGSTSTTNPSAFGAFSTATSTSRASSGAFASPVAAPIDPFGGFSPRTSSGSKSPEPPKTQPGDPFSAFDNVDVVSHAPTSTPAASAPAGSVYDAFGTVNPSPHQQGAQAPSPFGLGNQGFGQPQPHVASGADPFAFATPVSATNSFSNSGVGVPTKTNSFSDAPGSQAGFGGANAFGAFPQGSQASVSNAFGPQGSLPHGFPPQQQFQQQQQQHFQQHQVFQQQGQLGQYPGQGFPGHPGTAPQQQQWMQPNPNAPNANYAHQPTQGHPAPPGTQPPQNSAPSNAPKADVAAIKDPFAALSLGNMGLSSGSSGSNPASRGNSFAKPGASPAASATSSFNNGTPQSIATPSPFGASIGLGMGNAPLSSGGSRGNSFETPKSHFAAPTVPSPMASFSLPQSSAPSPTFPATSPSPMGSFAFPAGQSTPQKQNSFGDQNVFGAFASNSAPPAASSNPFDMF